jgi:HSP20 family molecular chaperone IbpA
MTKIIKYNGGLPAVSREEFANLFNVDSLFDDGMLRVDIPKKKESVEKNKKRKIL